MTISYDSASDILTIEGIQYQGDLFRALGSFPIREDEVFRIVRREDQLVTIRSARGAAVMAAFEQALIWRPERP